LLQFSNIELKIFVNFKLLLHWRNILCISNLSFVGFLEILLELIKLSPQYFALIFDFIEFASNIKGVPETILLDNGLAFCGVQIDDKLSSVLV